VNYDLGWGDATSITAYRQWEFFPLQDSDNTPLDILQVNVAKTRDVQATQEFRLASKPGAFSWQTAFFIMAVLSVLVALLNYQLLPAKMPLEPVIDDKRPEKPSFRKVLTTPGLLLICLVAFTCNIPYWGFLGWMPSYLAMARHIDLAKSGHLASIPFFVGFFGLVIGGWLGGGLFRRHCPELLALLWMGQGVGLILAYQADSLTLSLVGLSIAAFGLFGGTAPLGKVILDLAPERGRGAFVGVYNTVGQLGGAAAPAAIGGLVKLTGSFAAGFGLMVVGIIIAALCMMLIAAQQRRIMNAVAA